ncbi:MAG: oxidoreductase [Alphaproteobacteria bacterium]|nr:oxidoreductase [Alphaproteobacteria bacterium]
MERVTLSDDVSLSRIVYGMWRLGDDADTSPAHVEAKIESCLAQGITTMDQADIYGGYMAEEILGAALRAAPALKDRIEIVTKCGIVAPVGRHEAARVKYYDTGRAHITQSVEDSLRLMGIETIDLLLIHRPDPLMDHHETGATLDDLVASGKVRSVGVSNFRPWDWELLQSAMTTRLVTNQIEISVLAHHPFTNGDIAFLQRHGIPPMAWSPLAGGALFTPENKAIHDRLAAIAARHDSDVTSLVVAWLLAHPARIMPVMGTNSLDRIAQFGAAAKINIDRQTWYEIYTIVLGHEVA